MVPREKKYASDNNMPFLIKTIRGAEKRYLKKISHQNKKLYTKQGHFCISLLKRSLC